MNDSYFHDFKHHAIVSREESDLKYLQYLSYRGGGGKWSMFQNLPTSYSIYHTIFVEE